MAFSSDGAKCCFIPRRVLLPVPLGGSASFFSILPVDVVSFSSPSSSRSNPCPFSKPASSTSRSNIPGPIEFWKRQQQIHWMPEEVPLGEDCRDWAQKLTDQERNLLTQIFRFFTQADIEVQDCYHEKYGRVFKPIEIKMMLAAFSNMETVHIAAYSHLLDTIGMPESEYGMFLEYKRDEGQARLSATFGVDSDEDIARTLAMFGGFTEGLQLFASFAMLMNFPRFNKMKGMGQIVSWSVRDESLHCEGIIKLFHAFAKERDCLTKAVKHDIMRHVPDHRPPRGRVHRPRLRAGPGPRHDAQGDQEVHPLHRRLAARPARLQADLHDRRAPPPLARPAPQRRRARQLLRTARDRIFEGRDAGAVERSVGIGRERQKAKAGPRRTRMPAAGRICSPRRGLRRSRAVKCGHCQTDFHASTNTTYVEFYGDPRVSSLDHSGMKLSFYTKTNVCSEVLRGSREY